MIKHGEGDLDAWKRLRQQVARTAESNGWNKAEVARRTDIPDATFSQWVSGKYIGVLANQNQQIEQWLVAVAENEALAKTIPASPDTLDLRSTNEIYETLMWAQICPDLVMITFGAGMGKTYACERYQRTRPHVFMVTISENTRTVHGMLTEIAAELEVQEHNPAKLARAIGLKIRKKGDGSLLVVDEGQHLTDEAINQLRHFVDVYKCGVAIVGNEEIYNRFSRDKNKRGPSYAQLKSRVGKRLQIERPYPSDIRAFIDAWDIREPDIIQFLLLLGSKDGALRQIDKTVRMAKLLARGRDEQLALKHIEAAWRNRNVEDLA
jgi:hypothetical protein